jgi:hypothetical protein
MSALINKSTIGMKPGLLSNHPPPKATSRSPKTSAERSWGTMASCQRHWRDTTNDRQTSYQPRHSTRNPRHRSVVGLLPIAAPHVSAEIEHETAGMALMAVLAGMIAG